MWFNVHTTSLNLQATILNCAGKSLAYSTTSCTITSFIMFFLEPRMSVHTSISSYSKPTSWRHKRWVSEDGRGQEQSQRAASETDRHSSASTSKSCPRTPQGLSGSGDTRREQQDTSKERHLQSHSSFRSRSVVLRDSNRHGRYTAKVIMNIHLAFFFFKAIPFHFNSHLEGNTMPACEGLNVTAVNGDAVDRKVPRAKEWN